MKVAGEATDNEGMREVGEIYRDMGTVGSVSGALKGGIEKGAEKAAEETVKQAATGGN